MLEVRDAADAILLGLFLFGLLLSAATLLLGVADLGMHHGQADDGGLLPTSLGALLVFLSWLGGAGFVLRRAADWPLIAALPFAALLGLGVAAAMQWSVRKLSNPAGSVLEPEEYRLPGTLGHVSSSIRAGGTGEVVYEQGGVRHVVAARASGAQALPRGTEVVVLSVNEGIATVEVFDAFWNLDHGDESEALAGRG
jgi:membrane protein implicated in regulation of membrane protease activity